MAAAASLKKLFLLFALFSTVFISQSSQTHGYSNGFISTSSYPTTISSKSTNHEQNELNRIEEGLKRARYAIRRAARKRNLTNSDSKEKDEFVSRGSIYINPYAFHQSYIEMEKRLKVWTYKEGQQPLFHDGPLGYVYSTEGHFIDEMESGLSPFTTQNPDEAHLFFLPFSVVNIKRFILAPNPSIPWTWLQLFVEDYIKVVSDKYPFWNRSSGADHFMVSCHDRGTQISSAFPRELFKNLIRVLCNANTSEGFHPIRDATLPEVNLKHGELGHPQLGNQPTTNRPILAFFAGRAHGYGRSVLFSYWKDKDDEVRVYESLPKPLNYTNLMTQSKFCLCPSGYEVASPRIVEAIYVGCVPVILSDHYVLPFSDVLNWSQFSIQIPVQRIPEIKVILKNISAVEYLKMQSRVLQVKRHFILNRPAQRFDLLHMVLHPVWLRSLNIGFTSEVGG
ncbi:probable glycosyltransferase At5g20260 [Papaver somniferum]|uniref:probable glycosyltransferase At5g20260 n=1 Tax=Papaver somniferum TaxID=3469 RepID=UPI000E6FA8F0|nr:probable glycosyltransferase At5g20260 [Papaver somniferum]